MVMLAPNGVLLDPPIETLVAGATLFRLHSATHAAQAFNPGRSPATPIARFSFFGDPPVPALYASDAIDGAINETLLRDVPLGGGTILLDQVENRVLSPIRTTRDLRLLQLHGHGFRQLNIRAEDITRTSSRLYHQTVPWAESAYMAGLDGVVWMSRHHDSSRAYVFFGRPGTTGPVEAHPDRSIVRAFGRDEHLDWLTQQLEPLHVVILDPS
jgi:hypothetical protein